MISKNLIIELSIILPIYNVEPYLEKCIRSLENQDIPKEAYEIICVNDGSPDNCLEIIKTLQKEYSNIILIDQKNQGVSVARNNGIKVAKGDYLMFVDPDDAIEKNCLKDLIDYADINQYEAVYSPLTFVEINGEKEQSKYNVKLEKEFDGPGLYSATRKDIGIDPDRSYAILYKRDLIVKNDLFYLKDVPYLEDGEFIARVLCLTKRCSIYNKPYYLRLNRPGSATKSNLSIQIRSIKGFLKAVNNLIDFQEKEKLNMRQKDFLNQPTCKFVFLSIQACVSTIDIKKFQFVKNELKNNSLTKLNLKYCSLKYTKLGKVYNKSINFLFIYLILRHIKEFIILRLSTNE